MSTLTSYASAAARDSAAPAASNTGLCIFRSDNKAIEVSDGTNYLTYNNDGILYEYPTNTYSIDFDGSSDYVDLTAAASLLNSQSVVSMSFWYYADGYGIPLGARTSNTNAYAFWPYDASNFYWVVRNGGTETITASNPGLNQWVHVAGVKDGTSGTLYLTPAGGSTTITTGSTTGSMSSIAGNTFYAGRSSYGSVYFNGKVDEVAVWNRAISSSEVSDIINNKRYRSPAALWRLENNADATIGGSGFNGTNNGGTFVSGSGNTAY